MSLVKRLSLTAAALAVVVVASLASLAGIAKAWDANNTFYVDCAKVTAPFEYFENTIDQKTAAKWASSGFFYTGVLKKEFGGPSDDVIGPTASSTLLSHYEHLQQHSLGTEPCVAAGPAPSVPTVNNTGYCSVAGNTWPDGTPITPGRFLNLAFGQPNEDTHYTGATPAPFVVDPGPNHGLNCVSGKPTGGAPVTGNGIDDGSEGAIHTPITLS